jgi:hypothetical protein
MWRAITDNDLFAGMNSNEITAVRTKALTDEQGDPVADVISQVTMEIRDAIRSCGDSKLSPDASLVPEASILHAVAIIRHRLATRFPGMLKMSEERAKEYDRANKYVDMVASCDRKVERYGDEPDAAAPIIGPRVNGRDRRFTRADQEGI